MSSIKIIPKIENYSDKTINPNQKYAQKFLYPIKDILKKDIQNIPSQKTIFYAYIELIRMDYIRS